MEKNVIEIKSDTCVGIIGQLCKVFGEVLRSEMELRLELYGEKLRVVHLK